MTAHARIKCTIWHDGDFRSLGVDAQWAYHRLLSDSNRNHAGVLPLTRKRWAGSAAGMTLERVDAALAELVAATFVVLDEDTEEVLVRTYMRHNEIAAQPNVLKAALRQAAQVESPLLRSALAYELRLLPEKPEDTPRMAYPDPHAVAEAIDPGDLWRRLSVVREAPAQRDVSADQAHPTKGSANPSENPSGNPREREREKEVVSKGGVGGQAVQAVQPPLLDVVSEPKSKSTGTRLREDWKPTQDTIAWTRGIGPHVDLTTEWAKFQDYWMSRAGAGARKVDWDRTWKNWIRKAADDANRRIGRTASGMTPKDQKVANIVAMGQQMQAEREARESQFALPAPPGQTRRAVAEW